MKLLPKKFWKNSKDYVITAGISAVVAEGVHLLAGGENEQKIEQIIKNNKEVIITNSEDLSASTLWPIWVVLGFVLLIIVFYCYTCKVWRLCRRQGEENVEMAVRDPRIPRMRSDSEL